MLRENRPASEACDALLRVAVDLAEQRRFDEAPRMLRSSIEVMPRFAPADVNLGLVRVKQERLAEAIQLYEKALEINPTSQATRAKLQIARERLRQRSQPINHR